MQAHEVRQVQALMKQCQRGREDLHEANNLLADCYGALGKLLLDNQALFQQGYDEGRRLGTKTALSERDQLRAEVMTLKQGKLI